MFTTLLKKFAPQLWMVLQKVGSGLSGSLGLVGTLLAILVGVGAIPGLVVGVILLDGWLFQLAWNYTIPFVTNGTLPAIDTLHAIAGLFVLAAIGTRLGRPQAS